MSVIHFVRIPRVGGERDTGAFLVMAGKAKKKRKKDDEGYAPETEWSKRQDGETSLKR